MEHKQSAREIALNYLTNKMKSGQLKPGDKLMNERKLAEQLQISRVPLREAISTLSALGILEARQGDGTFVSSKNSIMLAKIIKTYGIFDRFLVDEVFEARILFEADAAKLAAANRTDADLAALETALERNEAALPVYYEGGMRAEQMMEFDAEIHLGIAASTHNNFMIQMIEALRSTTMSRHMFKEEFTLNSEHFKEATLYHRRVYQAILQRDAAAAYEIMQSHIIQARDAIDLEKLKYMEG